MAGTPYEAYGGEETAPINQQQQTGIGNINTQQGVIAGTGAPISAADIQRYQDPFTNQVIDATQRDFDVQNARQQSQVTGNAASQGALGGDRSAVAAALTAEGQGRSQAPVIAGLRSQGYQTAVKTAEDQQQQALRAGVAGLQGAQSQVGAGTLEQQTQQAKDTQGRQDYYQKQGYPFQVAQWLASIDTGVGSQMGGTGTNTGQSTTQGPTPNMFSQLAGLGLAGASMFANRGGRVSGVGRYAEGGAVGDDFNTRLSPEEEQRFLEWKAKNAPQDSGADYDLRGAMRADMQRDPETGHMRDRFKKPNHPTFSDQSQYAVGAERDRAGHWNGEDFVPPPIRGVGGRIHSYAGGGSPWGVDQTWIPQVSGIAAGRGAPGAPSLPSAPSSPQQKGLSADQMKGIGSIGKSAYGGLDRWLNGDPGSFNSPMAGLTSADYDPAGPGVFARGGRIGFAAGGAPDDDPSFDERFGAAFPRVAAGVGAARPAFGGDVINPDQPYRMLDRPSEDAEPPALGDWRSGVKRDLNLGQSAQADVPLEDKGPLPPEVLSGRSKASVMARGEPEEGDEGSSTAMGYAGRPRVISGVGAPASTPEGAPDEGFLSRLGIKMTPELRQGLLQAGLSMMATRHGGPGSFLQSAGEAGMTGVGAYSQTQQLAQAEAEKARKESFEREKFERPYSEMTAAQRAADTRAKVAAEKEKFQPGGSIVTASGAVHQLTFNPSTGEYIDAVTKKPPTDEDKVLPKNGRLPVSAADAKALAEYYVKTGDPTRINGLGITADARQAVQHQIKDAQDRLKVSDEDLATKRAEWEGRKAGQRVLGTQEAKMGSAAFEAEGAMNLARGTIDKVPRTSFLPLNKLIEGYSRNTLDPNQVELYGRAQAIVNTYAAVMARGANVTTDSSRAHAAELLNTAGDHATWNRMLDTMQQEIDMAKHSPARMREFYRQQYGPKAVEGDGTTAGSTTAPATTNKPKTVTQGGYTYTLQPDGSYK